MSGAGDAINGEGENEFEMDPGESMDALRTDLDDRVRRLKRGADDATQRLLGEIEDGIAELYDEVAARGSRAVAAIEQGVEEHPWTSLLVGFGLGCLVSQLLFRRR